jgi:hypothetical protein
VNLSSGDYYFDALNIGGSNTFYLDLSSGLPINIYIVGDATFGQSETPSYECIAVSQSADPTGAYNRYTFLLSNDNFHDYPHLGVWPDGYYMGTVVFSGNSAAGFSVFAFNRDEMLNGDSAPSGLEVDLTVDEGGGVLLPSDLDGVAPPAGSPNYLMYYGTNVLNLYKFHVDV